MNVQNKQILFKNRPSGWVTPENFEEITTPVSEPADGEMLLEILYLSVDPYMRARMTEAKSYIPPFQIGRVLEGGTVCRVVKSNGGTFPEGTLLSGMGHWANYMTSDGEGFQPIKETSTPLSYHLGILGMPGMTAYVGLKGVGQMQPGENIFVSAASGAVGQVVGQIGKIMGCHVAGSAGGPEKTAFLTEELGFDAALDYKSGENLFKAVAKANPNGIDVNFENVGGPIMEAALNAMNFNGRIAVCGMISDYNATLEDLQPGPRNLALLVMRSLTMKGFIVFNYPELCKEWVKIGSGWLKAGKLQYRETVADGIERAPQALIDVLRGNNFGKQVVKVCA